MFKHTNEIDLSGIWRFRLDPDNLGEHYAEQLDIPWQHDARWMEPTHDECEWESIPVPSCWQAKGHNYNGVAWYRRSIDDPRSDPARQRVWLRFEGVDYFSDAWLNGRYLGSHEGYFAAFQYEISDDLQSGENLLAVRVDSPSDISTKEEQNWQFKRLLKGALQRWDVNNPEINPGGIWNDVKLITTGPAAITALAVETRVDRLPAASDPSEPVPAAALLNVQLAGLRNAPAGQPAILRAELSCETLDLPPIVVERQIAMPAGPSTWQLTVPVPEARLWQTWDTGFPHLYRVRLSLLLDNSPSDQVEQTFGFRQLEQRQGWELYLNGHRIFQRGANYLSDQLLSTMTRERYQQDIELLRDANLNTVHPFCVVEKQDFYDLCDRAGILVYQDMPMWLEMDTGSDLVRRASRQLDELIAQFGNHPSIFVWNCGSQASVANFEKLGAALVRTARRLDPSRPVQQSNALIDLSGPERSPVGEFHWSRKRAEHFVQRYDWRIDTHQYYGWYARTLASLNEIPTEYLELVTEYGAQALPSQDMLRRIIPAEGLFPPVWRHYARRCFQPTYQFLHINRPNSLAQFVQDSQAYQSEFIQRHTEHYRRHKFAPCNGAHLFCFNDCWPAITWSVVDYDRKCKDGYYSLQRAMAPLQTLVDCPPIIPVGAACTLPVWLVNDYPRPYPDLAIDWSITPLTGEQALATGSLPGGIEANGLAQIGEIHWQPRTSGRHWLAVQLRAGDEVLAENKYHLKITNDPKGE